MEDVERKVIRTNHTTIQDIDLSTELLGKFYECGLLTEKMKYEVQDGNQRERISKFLDILPQRGPKAFKNFVAIIRRDYSWIADKLEDDVRKASTNRTERNNQSIEFEEYNEFDMVPPSPTLPFFAKHWLIQELKKLTDHLKTHQRNFVSEEKNMNTVRLDDVGKLINLTLSACNTKFKRYKENHKLMASEIEGLKSKIQNLTNLNEEKNKEFENAKLERDVFEFHLEKVKEQLNKSNKEIVELNAKITRLQRPEIQAAGCLSPENTSLSLKSHVQDKHIASNDAISRNTLYEQLAEKEMESIKVNSNPLVCDETAMADQETKINNISTNLMENENERKPQSKFTENSVQPERVVRVPDKLYKPGRRENPTSRRLSTFWRHNDQSSNIQNQAYTSRKDLQQQSVTRSQQYKEKGGSHNKKQVHNNRMASFDPHNHRFLNLRQGYR